ILRGIVGAGLVALMQPATAQLGPRPGEGVSAPVQTPTIINAPAAKPPAVPPQPTVDQRPPIISPRAAAERNEFQDFIQTSTGQRLPIFGQELFEGGPSTFAPIENIAVPANYIIGPGDELQIRAWGQIDVDYRAVVDRNGM